MKKFLLLFVAAFYLGSSTGATMHLHYCMGKVIERSMFASRESTCGGCGMEKTETGKDDCCKDEEQSFRNDTDQIQTEFISFSLPALSDLAPLVSIDIFSALVPSRLEAPLSHAPPRSLPNPYYLLHRQLLI